jgi:hypothetical protein
MNQFPKFLTLCCFVLLAAPLPCALSATVSTTAVADAFVAAGPTGSLGDNNYGGGGALAIAASALPNGEFQSVLRFNLAAVRDALNLEFGAGVWSIQSISLQFTSSPHNNTVYNEVSPGLFGVSWMQNSSWTEGTGNASNPANNGITYNTLQNTFINNAVDQPLGTFAFPGGTSGANLYSLNLAAGLTADVFTGGDASLRLFAADNAVSYLFSSRATANPASQPQLVIVAVPEPGLLALFGLAVTMPLLVCRFRRFYV